MAVTAVMSPTTVDGLSTNDARYAAWLGMKTGDVGAAFKVGEYAGRKMLHAILTGLVGSVSLRGSNLPNPDPSVAANWFPMNQANNTALAITASGGQDSNQAPMWVSPIVSGGDGTTSYNLYLLSKKNL